MKPSVYAVLLKYKRIFCKIKLLWVKTDLNTVFEKIAGYLAMTLLPTDRDDDEERRKKIIWG